MGFVCKTGKNLWECSFAADGPEADRDGWRNRANAAPEQVTTILKK